MAPPQTVDGFRFMQFALCGLLLASFFAACQVHAQTHFYKDKTITVLAATNPGGTADMRIRTVVSVLQKHIPGNPTIVVKYMAGGGGRMAANQLYKSTAPDGLTMGAMLSSYIPAAVVGDPGALYDVQKMIFLGTPYSGHPHIFISRRGAGADTLEKLRSIPNLRLGAQSVGHTIYYTGRMFAYLIGLKEPKSVIGYSGPELDIAFQSGEVDARSNHPDNPIRQGAAGKRNRQCARDDRSSQGTQTSASTIRTVAESRELRKVRDGTETCGLASDLSAIRGSVRAAARHAE